MADERGLGHLQDLLAERHAETGAARYEPAPEFDVLAEPGRTFHGEARDDEFDALRVETDGAVGRIVVDREHRLNAITRTVLAELPAAVERFEADDDVRAVLLTGAGDVFSAGADVNDLLGNAEPLDGVELSRTGQRAFGRLETADLPVVAGIEGYCLGGGMELATCADLRVASVDAEFGQVEGDLGLIPGWGGTQRLARLLGEGHAKEIVLTADRFDAETMREYGFLTEVVEGDAEARALELARDLASGPPLAHRQAKRAIHAGRGDRSAGLEVEAAAFGQLLASEDFSEGAAAFTADREPEFEGR
jgi:enoyl-CoA hydratase/3-hydroxyacyl-CoA dehydrogenase